jgi:hydroxypyruvate reductase
LILSDVVGDDPSVIGSGPTVADPTSFADAHRVLDRFGILSTVPPAARSVLNRGARGELPETLKPGDPCLTSTRVAVIGSNRLAIAAAAAEARRLGYALATEPATLVGDTTRAARTWAATLPLGGDPRRWCALAGGETTVVLRGRGRGGRNQEFALALAHPLAGRCAAVLSAGSDGIDGPTSAAGAFVDGSTIERARAQGVNPDLSLRDNDSHGFFGALGDLLQIGPTGTNVMDIKIALGVGSVS